MRQTIDDEAGFSLVEVLVAMFIMLVVIASFAEVFGAAASANHRAARRTTASLAAMQKLEELRTVAGPALAPSPSAALQSDVGGYSDRLPGEATREMFIRRWSIEPLPADPDHLYLLQVVILDAVGHRDTQITTIRRRGGV